MTVTHTRRRVKSEALPGLIHTCDNCYRDLSKIVRIKCAECEDIDLCVECFCNGEQMSTHKREHKYRVVEPFDFAIFDEDWRADEELLLLEGLEIHGMGNFSDVAEHIGTKSRQQVEEHYVSVYLKGYPSPNNPVKFKKVVRENYSPVNYRIEYLASPSIPSNHEIAGCMPKRDDFETLVDNEAEHVVKDISFSVEDTLDERELKLNLLRMYRNTKDKRNQRKLFIESRGLFDFKRHQSGDKHRSKEDREIINSIKPLARFMTAEDFDIFYSGLALEAEISQRIVKFCEYRKSGLTKFSEVSEYDRTKKQRTEVRDSFYKSPRVSRDDGFAKNAVSSRKVGAPLDISNEEGLELLSNAEKELSSLLRLVPKVYLGIKEILLKEYAKNGFLKRAQARSLIKIDVNKTSRIYDFFVSAGWVKPVEN